MPLALLMLARPSVTLLTRQLRERRTVQQGRECRWAVEAEAQRVAGHQLAAAPGLIEWRDST